MKEKDEFLVIGKDYPKVEVEEKVTGEYEFVGDISLPHMLHAKILRSPYAHALVKSINTKRAKELPGVKAVITHEDVKERWFTRAPGTHSSNPRTLDTRIIDEKMRYVGDRVAAVAATSLEIAEKALELIEVEYEELPAVFDPIEAMQPGAPVIHDSIKMADNDIPIKNNIVGPTYMNMGDVEEGFKQADLVVENEFRSGYVHNSPLGRPACVCRPLPGGGLEIWNQTQGIHVTRMCLSKSLDIPMSKIKVHRVSLGGAFGFYTYVKYSDIIGAFLALKTGLPLKIEQSREEMFLDGGRHPFVMRLKTGVKKDGTLTNKKLFCKLGSDGMTIDNEGNVYLTGRGVTIFNPKGEPIEQIPIEEGWTANVCFGGTDRRTLFITAKDSLYGIHMRVKGVN